MESTEKLQLNIGICDDDPAMVQQLERLCRQELEDSYQLQIDLAQTAGELLSAEHPFQIAILDVELVEADGIELAREIISRNSQCRILFVSGFLHAVSEVYEVPHFCFVLKEQIPDQLPRFLNRAAQLAAEEAGETVLIACGRRMESVLLSKITFLERRGHRTTVNLTDGTSLETREKLGELLIRIQNTNFVRCHVSYAVNLHAVRELKEREFLLQDGTRIPISRPNENQAREAFFRYLGEQFR